MIHRQVYRSILRSCERGRRVECLPCDVFFAKDLAEKDAHAPSNFPLSETLLPRTPEDVRRRLRRHARTTTKDDDDNASRVDPFAVMRRADARRYAFSEAKKEIDGESPPPEYPAFVLPSHTLLPGENATFHMFEPRYVRMCRRMMREEKTTKERRTDDDDEGDGFPKRFVHLAARKESIRTDVDPIGTIVTVNDMRTLHDGRVLVACLAGPRVRVLEQREEEMDDGSSPLLHVSCEAYRDNDEEAAGEDACRDLLEEIFRESEELRALLLATPEGGMPPLFCAEDLSLWMCGSFLDPGNVRERLANLYTQDTEERLSFAYEEAARFLARARGAKEG